MEEVRLNIDGQTVLCTPGTTIWNAARAKGIRIPNLCHHPDLKPAGACRICLVEDEKSGRILASCVTPAASGMVIRTDSPVVLRHRANIVRLIMANHPESCIVCDQGNRCRLRAVASELGIGRIDLDPMMRTFPLEEANPFIVRDLSKCILCGRCIRADRELVVVGAIDYHFRGFQAQPATFGRRPLEDSTCTFCGTCVALCPTGALRTKTPGYAGSPESWSEAVCGFCAVGCSLSLGTSAGRIVDVEPSKRPGTVNGATLCVRGHFEHDYLNTPDRLVEPALRSGGSQVQGSWEDVVSFVVQGLRLLRDKHGPQSLAFWGSTRCSLEENYLFQKLARTLLGLNNVGSGEQGGVVESRLGKIAARTISEIERAEAILVVGANPTDSSPVLGYAVKRVVRQRGASLVVLDPMRIDLVSFSSAWLSVAPREDGVILDALAAGLLEHGARPADGVEGWEAYAERLSCMDREAACRQSGVDPSSLKCAVDTLAGKRIAFVVGRGILTQPHAAAAMRALENLALLTDSLEGEARGFFFLSGENNAEGALDMGASPGFLPGRLRVQDAESRRYWERIWGVRISPDPGLNRKRALEEMEKGNLKALFVMGENPLRELPRPERTRSALEKLDLLVVQDILQTETSRMAHAVLPGAAFSEKEGSFTNLEGRIQGFEAAVSPPGRAMADWRILAAIYDGLAPSPGKYESIEDVRREIRDHVPGYKAMETRPGGKGTPQYRCEPDSREGREKPVFREAGPLPDGLGDSGEYPFLAVLGSVRSHVGNGTRTSRSGRLGEFRETGDLEMNPEDCRRMDVHPGEAVRVVSRHGAVERDVRPSRRVRPGFIFVPKGAKGNRAVDLVDLLKNGNTPSACRVRIEKAGNGRRP